MTVLIAIEGADGVGKNTAAQNVAAALCADRFRACEKTQLAVSDVSVATTGVGVVLPCTRDTLRGDGSSAIVNGSGHGMVRKSGIVVGRRQS